MTDVYIVPDYRGPENGSKEQPYSAATSDRFDSLMRSFAGEEDLHFKLGAGRFPSVFTSEWNDSNVITDNPGWRLGRTCTLDLDPEAVLVWDVDNIPQSHVTGKSPIWGVITTEARFDSRLNLHTPEEVWNLRPRGQAVRGGTIDLQFTKAVDRWKAAGETLMIGGVLLAGDQAYIEGVRARNYGTLGIENFLFYIQTAVGMYDRDRIARTDVATHISDANLPDEECSHITDCVMEDYDVVDSTNTTQVSCAFIAGNVGQLEDGTWVQHRRAYAYAERNHGKIVDKRPNRVQLTTLYQCLRGHSRYNKSEGFSVGHYADTYGTSKVDISLNEFLECQYHGIHLPLSPAGPCPEQYFHEGYTIGINKITSNMENVKLDPMGPMTDRRYIRDMSVDLSLTLADGGEGTIRTGQEMAKKGGCGR